MDNNALTAGLYLVLDEKELIMNANHGVFRKEKRAGKKMIVGTYPILCRLKALTMVIVHLGKEQVDECFF